MSVSLQLQVEKEGKLSKFEIGEFIAKNKPFNQAVREVQRRSPGHPQNQHTSLGVMYELVQS